MFQNIFLGLIYNAALLLSLAVVLDAVILKSYREIWWVKVLIGSCLGLVVIAIMSNPWVLRPGIVFDTRSVLLSVAGMFFGYIPSLIAATIALVFRILQGGSGAIMGSLVIVSSVFWGILWKKLHAYRKKPYSYWEFYSLGLVTHVSMLALTQFLPAQTRYTVLRSITLPVMIIYPLATVLLGQILVYRIKRRRDQLELERSESQFRKLYENAPIAYQSLDIEGNFVTVNQAWLHTMGYSIEDVLGRNFSEFLNPESIKHFHSNFARFKAQGFVDGVELTLVRRDGTEILVSFNGKIITDEDGRFKQTQCVFTDITEHRRQAAALKSMEWMLGKQDVVMPAESDYGDLTELNTNRLILDSVGKDVLRELTLDYLSLLNTSAAVYEKNGDYALGLFTSSWCQFMDSASRNLCESPDNRVALASGKWLCHESCWTEVSRKAIEDNVIVDQECNGGLHLYAVPITISSGVIGAINLGYGNPPQDEETLRELATKYKVDFSLLKEKAAEYQARPPFIIEQAKARLRTSARIIGEIVQRKLAEEERNRYAHRLEILRDLDSIVLETLSLRQVCKAAVENLQQLIPFTLMTANITRDESVDIVALVKPETGFAFLEPGGPYPPNHDYLSELREKRTLIINDLTIHNLPPHMPIAERLVQSGMKSFMYNAMILQDEMVGFLWFMSDQKDFFTQEYREIADEFANQLGIVLSHLQLIEAIKGHTEDLESKVEERTEQLLIANKELEAFSYTVAHDLRTPLRTIDGYCNIMLEDYTATLPNKAKEVLQIIIKTTHKMDILIKELLQLARLNRDALHYSSLDMTHMVQNVLNNIRETQLIEGFSIDISPLEPCQGDYALMSEVWQNLLENAIKFTLPCPVKSIQIGSRKEPNEAVYFVKDTGVGFDMQYVDKIFAVFQRLHRERDFEGTGIGLAIVKKVIERHNGQVWAESFVGKGTTVYFSIPH